jgi:hypothetical protein
MIPASERENKQQGVVIVLTYQRLAVRLKAPQVGSVENSPGFRALMKRMGLDR